MSKISIVYHGVYGHTTKQADAVLEGASSVTGAHAKKFLLPNRDLWDELLASDAIIFGSAVHMGSVTSAFSLFMEESSKVWIQQGWKDKLAAGFVNSSSVNGDKFNAMNQLVTLAGQHSMLWVSLGLLPGRMPHDLNTLGGFLGAYAHSPNNPEGEAPSQSDLKTAYHLGRRVAELSLKR